MAAWLAALVASAVAAAAWGARALTPRGAVAAAIVGALILATAGWPGGAALFAFFVTSSALSALCPDPAAAGGEAKGGRRDAAQVLANGGAAAAAAVLTHWSGAMVLWAATSALAAAAADTWATAIGGTATTAPVHLLSGARVPPGTSGAVTLRGTIGAAAGATIVALAAGLSARDHPLIPFAAAIGFAGMGLDSALGATVQARFQCPACAVATERPRHRCGARTTPVGGIRWLTNDGVNALTTLAAATAGALGWWWLAR